MNSDRRLSRRTFVASGSLAGAGAVLLAYPELSLGAQTQSRPGQSQRQSTGQSQTAVKCRDRA